MDTATTRPTRREQHTTQQSNTKWAPRKKEKTTITNRHDLNGGRNSAGESGSLLVGHGLGGPFHSCRCFVSDTLGASSGPVEVFSSGDAFSLPPHGSLVRFAFPLSPLFLRVGSGHALDHFGLVSLPCRVACPVGTGGLAPRLSFGAGPSEACFPGLAVGALAVWSLLLLPLSLFISLGWGVQAASALQMSFPLW